MADIPPIRDALLLQRDLLIAVATGEADIKSLNGEYVARQTELAGLLRSVGLKNPFPWRGLWDWYGRWSSGEMPTYRDRRAYIRDLVDPVLEELERREGQAGIDDWGQTEDLWQALETRLTSLKEEVAGACDRDGWQDVGRRGREIIIDVVNHVFEDQMVPEGEDIPKGSDAKARLECYLAARVPGASHQELRSLVNKALELCHKVTHSRSITAVDAFVSAQATVLVVRSIQKIEDVEPADS